MTPRPLSEYGADRRSTKGTEFERVVPEELHEEILAGAERYGARVINAWLRDEHGIQLTDAQVGYWINRNT